MPSGALQPAEAIGLRCPRCWTLAPMIPTAALTVRCARCEWLFTLAAATVATPAVPLTTVAVVNGTGTPVAVTISAGTITSVVINGVQVGTSAGTYTVQVAGAISITYSVAPTWAWALPAISAGVSASATALPFTAGGTAFAVGQVLIIDPAGTSDVVTVNAAPTATSVPVTGANAAHLTGVLVSVAQITSALSSVEAVPLTSY